MVTSASVRARRTMPLVLLLCGAAALLAPDAARAQATVEDYRRALGLEEELEDTVTGVPEEPQWSEDGGRFWYRTSVEGGDAFVLVEPASREQRRAFDHERLARALTDSVEDESYAAVTLPFEEFEFVEEGGAIEFDAAGAAWRCGLGDYACRRLEEEADAGEEDDWCGWLTEDEDGEGGPVASPDGGREAYVRDGDVWVRPAGAEDSAGRALSHDGAPGDAYAEASISWSPDGEKIAAYRVDPAPQRRVHYVEAAPEDRLQPAHRSCPYTKPGDELDDKQPVLFDVASGRKTVVDDSLFPDAYEMSELQWWEDGRAFTFEYNERGHRIYRVIEVDAESGEARALITEDPETFFDYSGSRFRHDVDDGDEIVWMSERDGWNHLYLYDGETGEVEHRITEGRWVVRGVDHVDEEDRTVYFHASGRREGRDPYFVHYYRVNFDGSGLRRLTEGHGTHDVTFSPDMEYFVDTWSRVDEPPVSELRRTSDGRVLMTLEEADAGALYETGWSPPEVFTAEGRDDSTDIWGIIVRPTDFDPGESYPVIEYIYAGPHGSFVPKEFGTLSSMQALAELGFIVVQIDGMGTDDRSKAFHDVAWRDLADAGFPDRKAWHRAAAERYPAYDTTRVGIYGTSAGGQNAMGAVLFHPDFYDAAVAASGAHDNRMDKIWWNEQWMGELGPHYAESSNAVNAGRLEGELMLIVGGVDRNVPPSTTLQVAEALIWEGKTFEMVYMPTRGHTSGGDYGDLRRFDFFVEHLHGVDPPNWNDPANAAEVPVPGGQNP